MNETVYVGRQYYKQFKSQHDCIKVCNSLNEKHPDFTFKAVHSSELA